MLCIPQHHAHSPLTDLATFWADRMLRKQVLRFRSNPTKPRWLSGNVRAFEPTGHRLISRWVKSSSLLILVKLLLE